MAGDRFTAPAEGGRILLVRERLRKQADPGGRDSPGEAWSGRIGVEICENSLWVVWACMR